MRPTRPSSAEVDLWLPWHVSLRWWISVPRASRRRSRRVDRAATSPGMGAHPEYAAPNCCHDGEMGAEVVRRTAARAATWPLAPVLLLERAVRRSGRRRRPLRRLDRHLLVGRGLPHRGTPSDRERAGRSWGSAPLWRGVPSPRTVCEGDLFVALGDSSFVWWFMFLAHGAAAHADVDGLGSADRCLWSTIASAVVFQVSALLRSTPTAGTARRREPVGRWKASPDRCPRCRPWPSSSRASACWPRSWRWSWPSCARAARPGSSCSGWWPAPLRWARPSSPSFAVSYAGLRHRWPAGSWPPCILTLVAGGGPVGAALPAVRRRARGQRLRRPMPWPPAR